MEVKLLLFNIYTFYLLNPIMATLCGSNLVDALKHKCKGRGYYNEAVIQPTISRTIASQFLTPQSHPRRIRRRSGLIVNECCLKDCSQDILESYCMPRITTTTPATSTTPAVTLLLSTTTKTTMEPSRDNVLTDYESPTNAGPFTSGQPTPTDNRISTEMIEHLNASVNVPIRTANNSRVEDAVQDSSDQDSLDENSETESEAPTRGTRRRTKKPKHKPPKKNKKERKKKKEKERSNRHRNNSKKQRGDSVPDPTRSEQSHSSEQSRNTSRGKVNESQGRQHERNQNNDEDIGTLNRLKQRIIDTLLHVNLPPDVDAGRSTEPQRSN